MATLNLLYSKSVQINDKISVVIPTVGEILDHETIYYSLFSALTGMPIDFMVQLDDDGLDFSTMTDYDLFLYLFPYIQSCDKGATSLVFGDLDLTKFRFAVNEETGVPVLIDTTNDIVIDRRAQSMIASALRMIHGTKKDKRKPANIEAKEYMISVARRRMKRRASKQQKSQLEQFIVAMVNAPEFKYNFETVRDLSIYQFNESLKQVVKKVDYDKRMIGVYAGTVKVKDLSKDDLNWLIH